MISGIKQIILLIKWLSYLPQPNWDHKLHKGGAVAGKAEGGPAGTEGEVPGWWLEAENSSYNTCWEQSYKENPQWNSSYKIFLQIYI